MAGLAFAADGTLFAAVNPDSPTAGGPVLATIDLSTGAGQIIGPIGYCVESLAMSADGTLFATVDVSGCSDAQTLATINTTTGQSTIIGPLGFVDVSALAFADGTLFGVQSRSGTLFSINQATGTDTAIGPTGFSWMASLDALTDATAPPTLAELSERMYTLEDEVDFLKQIVETLQSDP